MLVKKNGSLSLAEWNTVRLCGVCGVLTNGNVSSGSHVDTCGIAVIDSSLPLFYFLQCVFVSEIGDENST